ncbi:hypothetical protein ACGFNU_34620 [Spirillospora sp. NPDC048911]|uniref:hypothetical protein n=1 Tax=Spirillospora sp. NPDC048911 TaxID=3364527 RepID=UPI00371CBF6E
MRRRISIVLCALLLVTVASQAGRGRAVTTRSPGGRACMVYAPLVGMGHVGWAVRTDSGLWYGGATETKEFWPRLPGKSWMTGPYEFPRLLAAFRSKRPVTPYRAFRCRNVPGDSAAAVAQFRRQAHSQYDVFHSNCLTRTVRTLKSYSIVLGDLPGGVGSMPSTYFHNTLSAYGWQAERSF